MKKAIVDALSKHKHLDLASKRRGPLIDFLTTLPGNLTRAATGNNIIAGSIENGMIDKETQSTPDIYNMISTCRRLVLADELKLCEESFPALYKHQLEHGHIPDSVYDALGFAQDLDPNNEIVRRDDGITREPFQRAKTLSHQYQRKLRLEIKQQAQAVVASKRAALVTKVEKILNNNKQCEIRLCTLLEETHSTNMSYANCTIEQFGKCNVEQLKGFIHTRQFSTHLKSTDWKWPSKKKDLVELAYERRHLEIILVIPPEDENEPEANTIPLQPTVVE